MLQRIIIGLSLVFGALVYGESADSYMLVGDNLTEDPFMKEVAAFLAANDYFNLASYDGSAARVRPVKFVCVLNNQIAMVTSDKKEMCAQMRSHAQVELTRTAIDRSAYLRYLAQAVECKDRKLVDALLADHDWPEKKFKENLVVFLLKPKMAGIFSMKGLPPKTKIFHQ